MTYFDLEGAVPSGDACDEGVPNVGRIRGRRRQLRVQRGRYPRIRGTIQKGDVGDLRLRRGIFWTDPESVAGREGRQNTALGLGDLKFWERPQVP